MGYIEVSGLVGKGFINDILKHKEINGFKGILGKGVENEVLEMSRNQAIWLKGCKGCFQL